MTEPEDRSVSTSWSVARFTRSNGELVPCELVELSPGYVMAKTKTRLALEEFVLVGEMVGKVVFRHESGVTIKLISGRPDPCDSDSNK